jgi:hypothetical protein
MRTRFATSTSLLLAAAILLWQLPARAREPEPAAGSPAIAAATVADAGDAAMPSAGEVTLAAVTSPDVTAAEAALLAVASAGDAPAGALDTEMQALKDEVLDLNQELFLLEEELLFPANTQVAVFVSMDVGEFFALDSVQLRIDDKLVSNYLYTEREVQALQRGGVHRFYLGNLKTGTHELTATFTGKGPHERDYRRGATLKIEKGIGAKFVELRISDRVSKLQPEFVVREWE